MGRKPLFARDALLAAARTVFAEKGFEGATLADIAGRLGVTAAAVLRHAGSKQALFDDAMHRSVVDVPEAILTLATTDPRADPREVLRRFALSFIPFVRGVLQVDIARHLHHSAQRTSLVVPFDVAAEDTPPRRGIAVVERYFAGAVKAGRIRPVDPAAAARLFVGSLQSYVFIHDVLRLPPYPLDRFVDALLDLWTEGLIAPPQKSARRGGIRARKETNPAADPGGHPRRARDRGGVVAAEPARAEGARPRRDAGGEDGERRVARGRKGRRNVRR